MKKTLIVYSSKTGNTRKLAEAADHQLGGFKKLCSIDKAPDPSGYDLVALGFHLMAGKPDPASFEYLRKIGTAALFLFATHGAAAGSEHADHAMALAKSLAPAARVMGTFSCPGEVDPSFLDKARKKEPPPPWIKDAPAAAGHPDESDFARLSDTLKGSLAEYLS